MSDTPALRLPQDAEALLEASYGISHPNALARLLPTICATSWALHGLTHDPAHVDPLVRRQIQHSLTLDARPLTTGADIAWGLDHPVVAAGRRARSTSTTRLAGSTRQERSA